MIRLVSIVLLLAFQSIASVPEKPNIVVIFNDDRGYGDIEPFGSTINKTPHLNRMAREGMKLTSFYVASAVCTPSQAALMTGCYPQRVGLPRGSDHAVLFPGDHFGRHPTEITIAELLQDAGYKTGCFGKWHLGDQPQFLPPNQGFDTYYGIPYSNGMWPGLKRWDFPSLPILRDNKVIDTVDDMKAQGTLCKRFTEEAIQFIHDHKAAPFFLYLPHAFVHHPRSASDTFLKAAGYDGEIDNDKGGQDREYLERIRTKAQIEEVDWSVGQIQKTIRDLSLARRPSSSSPQTTEGPVVV
jgi:arylsulfatase A